MRIRIFAYVIIVLQLVVLQSCKPGVPSGVLSPGKMEDVLYDYHMAQGLAMQARSDSMNYYTRLYQQAVYDKYDIDAATFDRSMEWYARHTAELGKIYTRLSERMGDVAAVSSSAKLLAPGEQTASGDTLNIWHGANYAILNSKSQNRLQFSEPADTVCAEGDRLIWKFQVGWHYNEGLRQAIVVMAIHYEGDSVAVSTNRVFSGSAQSFQMPVAARKVKRVEGFVYQDSPWTERPRLLVMHSFQLLRVRKQPDAEPQLQTGGKWEEDSDSSSSSKSNQAAGGVITLDPSKVHVRPNRLKK